MSGLKYNAVFVEVRQRWDIFIERQWLPYYQALALREQRLLQISAIVLPLIIFVFGVILPLMDTQTSKKHELLQLRQQVEEAETLAMRLEEGGLTQGGIQTKGNTMTVVDQTARKAKVRQFITRMRPQMGTEGKQRLLIQMRAVPYASAVRFFTLLSDQGLSLMRVKFQKAEQSGDVQVQAVVE